SQLQLLEIANRTFISGDHVRARNNLNIFISSMPPFGPFVGLRDLAKRIVQAIKNGDISD
ncbi:MAG TPA: hypothetical protein VGI83_09850, partial [Gemmatimonadales bacterium]